MHIVHCTIYYVYCGMYMYIVGPPKKDRKQSIKNKNNRSLSFHIDFLALSGFSDVPVYLKNCLIKLICMHIIRTSSIRGLK